MDDVTPDLAHSPAKPDAPVEPPAPPLTRLRRFMKRLMFVGLGLLVIAVVVFFMLPAWMSGEQGRAYVLSRINKRMNGVIAVESWSLSWFSGAEIRNMTLAVDGKTILTCPHIKTDLGLWSLLRGNFDLGNTRLDAPQLAIAKYSDGSSDFSRLMLPPGGVGGVAEKSPFETLAGYIVCKSGSVELTSPNGTVPVVVQNISAEILAFGAAPIHLRASGEGFNLVVDFPRAAAWASNPYATLLSVQFRAAGLPTSTVAEWLGLDPRWDKSLGATLPAVSLMSEPQDASNSIVTLQVKGTIGNIAAKANFGVRAGGAGSGSGAVGNQAILSLVEQADPAFRASVQLSPPVLGLLAHVNPVLADVAQTADAINAVSGKLSVDLLRPNGAVGQVTLNIPNMTIMPGALLSEILTLAGTAVPQMVGGDINPLILTLAGGRLTLPEMVLRLASRQQLTFSGSVGFDDSLDLVLKVPVATAMGSGSVRVPITGTIKAAKVEKP